MPSVTRRQRQHILHVCAVALELVRTHPDVATHLVHEVG
jgi:hypothetical protein